MFRRVAGLGLFPSLFRPLARRCLASLLCAACLIFVARASPNAAFTAQAAARLPIRLWVPLPETEAVVYDFSGEAITLEFKRSEMLFTKRDWNLVMVFPNRGIIIFPDFFEPGTAPPTVFIFSDGRRIQGTQVKALGRPKPPAQSEGAASQRP